MDYIHLNFHRNCQSFEVINEYLDYFQTIDNVNEHLDEFNPTNESKAL